MTILKTVKYFCICISICLLGISKGYAEAQKEEPGYVLLVGGAGFIGSYVNEMLYQEGYATLVLDNLSTGDSNAVQHGIFIKDDLSNKAALDEIFHTYPIKVVMHFAASKSVGESVKEPLKYYINNVANTLNLLEAMLNHNVKKIIFSSSAAVFGIPETEEIDEEHPLKPINPYGRSKLMGEMILRDMDTAYQFKSICLRYFNVAGGDPAGKRKNYEKNSPNLIPIVLNSLKDPEPSIKIFGTDYKTPDGSGMRDYIHIEDIGTAHLLALKRLLDDCPSAAYNLGTGQGSSVKNVVATVERVTNRKITTVACPRREGDPARIIANPDKARNELNWHPKYTELDEIVQHAWHGMPQSDTN